MMHTSVQYTPLQVLQAARRAEAEGKMDYALQFYRHIVENHGATPEAQEAREGLMRIAEWRWSETRGGARRQEYGGNQTSPNPSHNQNQNQRYAPPPPSEQPQQRPDPYADTVPVDAHGHADEHGHLPQIIAREAAKAAHGAEPVTQFAQHRAARIVAQVVGIVGWVSVVAGFAITIVAAAGSVEQASVAGLLGLPLGVVVGLPGVVVGLTLVLAGHLATAVFEGTNATLELLSIERSRAG
jgi:hypothetical protein